jgi:hypothetical protein
MQGGGIGGCDVSLQLNVSIGLYFALWIVEGRSGKKWGAS